MVLGNEFIKVIEIVLTLLSTIIAVVALFVAFRAERRGHDRFRKEQEMAERVASVQIKPLVSIYSQKYSHTKSLILINRGLGPALLTRILFYKGQKSSRNVADLFHFTPPFDWQVTRVMPNGVLSVAAGESIVLARITEEHLLSKGATEDFCKEVMRSWHEQKKGMRVSIQIKDAFDNELPQYIDVFK